MSEGVGRERKRAMWRVIYHAPREDQRHQSGGLTVALAKLNLDALRPDRRRRGRRCRQAISRFRSRCAVTFSAKQLRRSNIEAAGFSRSRCGDRAWLGPASSLSGRTH